eukprot:6896753-Prymnesium_polylepis.1
MLWGLAIDELPLMAHRSSRHGALGRGQRHVASRSLGAPSCSEEPKRRAGWSRATSRPPGIPPLLTWSSLASPASRLA